MPPQTKIAAKLQAMTTFAPALQSATYYSRLQDSMYITQQHEVPPSKLPFDIKDDKFPTYRPMSQEERQWLYFAVKNGIQRAKDPFSYLEFLQAGIFEVYRHLLNADKIPANYQYNYFTDLINSLLMLSDFAGDVCNYVIADNLSQYQYKLEESYHADKIYLLNKRIYQLELDLGTAKKQVEDQVWKVNYAEYNLSEMQKQRDMKVRVAERLSKKVEEFYLQIYAQELQIAELQSQQAAIYLLLKGSSEAYVQEHTKVADTKLISAVAPGAMLTNAGSAYNPRNAVAAFSQTKDIVQQFANADNETEADYSVIQMAKSGKDGFLEYHLQRFELSYTVTKAMQDKVNLINPYDAELDLIPPVYKMYYNGFKAQYVTKTIGYSRIEQAEAMLANGVPLNDVENALDKRQQDNITDAVFMNADILDYENLTFNYTTKEIQAFKKKLVPVGMNEENVVFASQRLVEAMTDIAHDDAYALEQRALTRNASGLKNTLGSIEDLVVANKFSCLKLELYAHKAALESFVNPLLADDLSIRLTEVKIQSISPYRMPKCVYRTNSCVKAILNASPAHGGIIGIFNTYQMQSSADAFKTALCGVCGEYQKSAFGANFCSAQRNPFVVDPIGDEWAVCQPTTYQAGDQNYLQTSTSGGYNYSIFSYFVVDYIKQHKEPPHIGNLAIWRIKRMGGKGSAFSISGLKIKPATNLSRTIREVVFKRLNDALSGQEFDKKMNERVIKCFAAYYKSLQLAASAKTAAYLYAALSGFNAREITEQFAGLPVVSSCMKYQGLILFPFEKLIQQIDLILVNRYQMMDNIKRYGVFYRSYIPFSTYLRTYFLELMAFDEQKADCYLISLSTSCVMYLAYLDMISLEQKAGLLRYDDTAKIIVFDNGIMSCCGSLLELFLQLLNEQISAYNAEFVVFVYNALRRCAMRTRVRNYTFVPLEAAYAAAASLFPVLQTTGVSGFLKGVSGELMQILERDSLLVGQERVIDMGCTLQIMLRCKEELCAGLISYATRQAAPDAQISAADYALILSYFAPQIKLNSQPLFDLVRALYASFANNTAAPRTLKNLLQNPDYYISQNTLGFSLAIYDFYAQHIPILGLHKLFYATHDHEYDGLVDESAGSGLEQQIKYLAVIFTSQGLGLSPFLEPFSLREALSSQNLGDYANERKSTGVNGDADAELTFIDQQRPGILSCGHAIALNYLVYKQCRSPRVRMRRMQHILVQLITAIPSMRCFASELSAAEKAQLRFLEFGQRVIESAIGLLHSNSYSDELQAALGMEFDASINDDTKLMLIMAKSLVECGK